MTCAQSTQLSEPWRLSQDMCSALNRHLAEDRYWLDVSPLEWGQVYVNISFDRHPSHQMELVELPFINDEVCLKILEAVRAYEKGLPFKHQALVANTRTTRLLFLKLEPARFDPAVTRETLQQRIDKGFARVAGMGSVVEKLDMLAEVLGHVQQWRYLVRALVLACDDVTHPRYRDCCQWLVGSPYANRTALTQYSEDSIARLPITDVLARMGELSGLSFKLEPMVLDGQPLDPHWALLPNDLVDPTDPTPFLDALDDTSSSFVPFYLPESRIRWEVENFRSQFRVISSDPTPHRLVHLCQILRWGMRAQSPGLGEMRHTILFNQEVGLIQAHEAEVALTWAEENRTALGRLQVLVVTRLKRMIQGESTLKEIPILMALEESTGTLPDETSLPEYIHQLKQLRESPAEDIIPRFAALLHMLADIRHALEAFTEPVLVHRYLPSVNNYDDPFQAVTTFGNLYQQFGNTLRRLFLTQPFFTMEDGVDDTLLEHKLYLQPDDYHQALDLCCEHLRHAVRQLDYSFLQPAPYLEIFKIITQRNKPETSFQLASLSRLLSRFPAEDALIDDLRKRFVPLASIIEEKCREIMRHNRDLQQLEVKITAYLRGLLDKRVLEPRRARFKVFALEGLGLTALTRRFEKLRDRLPLLSSAQEALGLRIALEALEMEMLVLQERCLEKQDMLHSLKPDKSESYSLQTLALVRDDIAAHFADASGLHKEIWLLKKDVHGVHVRFVEDRSTIHKPVWVDYRYLKKRSEMYHFREGISLLVCRDFIILQERHRRERKRLEVQLEAREKKLTSIRYIKYLLKDPQLFELECSYLRISLTHLSPHYVASEGAFPWVIQLLTRALQSSPKTRHRANELWHKLVHKLSRDLTGENNHPYDQACDLLFFRVGKLFKSAESEDPSSR